MSKNSSFIEVGIKYCESVGDCRKCPLLHLPCVDASGYFYCGDEHSIEDLYSTIYHIANFDGDNDFMK